MVKLEDLPAEILHQILVTLPSAALFSLAQTNKVLNAFSESYLWASMDLSQTGLRAFEDAPADDVNIDWLENRVGIILAHVPKRAQYVKRLKFYMTRNNYSSMAQLLDRFKTSLVAVHIEMVPTRLLWDPIKRINAADQFSQSLRLRQITFTALKKLDITLSLDSRHVFTTMLERSSSLEFLTIRRLAHSAAPPSQFATRDLAFVTLPHLTSLSIELVTDEYVPFILNLFKTSPLLRDVRLSTAYGFRKRPWWKTIFEALQALPNLTSLDIDHYLVTWLCPARLNHLRSMRIRREYISCHSQSLQDIQIPPLRSLEKLEIYPARLRHRSPVLVPSTNIFPCNYLKAALDPSSLSREVPATFVDALKEVPNLRLISFPCYTGSEDAGEGSEGETIKIRRWQLASAEFIWIKRRGHIVCDEHDQVHHLDGVIEQDHTHWCGGSLTEVELSTLCVEGEIEPDWTEPVAYGHMARKGLIYLSDLACAKKDGVVVYN